MPSDPRSGADTATVPHLDRLRAARGFVFDMDGTLVLGDRRNQGLTELPGALDLLRWLADRDVPYAVITNGTTRTPEQYAAVLRGRGFVLGEDRLLTPASGATTVLTERDARRVMVLGHDAIRTPIREAGMEVVDPVGRPQADAVMVGWFPEFTLSELEAACHAIWGGAGLYSASQSLFFATAEGRTLGTSRVICGAIEAVTGVAPEIVGKPSPHLLRSAATRLGVSTSELAVVGDDPALEPPMAHACGSLAVTVETGVGGAAELAELPADAQPHFALRGVDELLEMLRAEGA